MWRFPQYSFIYTRLHLSGTLLDCHKATVKPVIDWIWPLRRTWLLLQYLHNWQELLLASEATMVLYFAESCYLIVWLLECWLIDFHQSTYTHSSYTLVTWVNIWIDWLIELETFPIWYCPKHLVFQYRLMKYFKT